MNERKEIRSGKQVTVVERKRTPDELEREDLLLRLEALEQEAKLRNPEFQVPEPPVGLQRRKATQAQ
jgi:hypothetical protein